MGRGAGRSKDLEVGSRVRSGGLPHRWAGKAALPTLGLRGWARSWQWEMNELFGPGEWSDKSSFNPGVANSSEASEVPRENEVNQVGALVSHPSRGPLEGAATTELWKIILREARSGVAKIHISKRNLHFSCEIS